MPPTPLRWQLHADGSFSAVAPPLRLGPAWPAVDGEAVRPIRVEVTRRAGGGRIRYRLASGELTLALERRRGRLVLRTTLAAMRQAPREVTPLAGAAVEGADRFFRQSRAMGWGTGLVDLTAPAETGAMESRSVSALLAPDDTTLTIFATDLAHFTQQSDLAPAREAGRPRRFSAGFRTERVALDGGRLALPDLELTLAPRPWDGLRAAAEAIARSMHARPRGPTSYHWCSWYYLYHNFSEALLEEYLAGLAGLKPPVPIQTVQIDAGYFPAAGDWLEPCWQWPSGLERALGRIRDAGYRPGIWIAPFMVGNRSRLFREHPDWVLHDLDGRPVIQRRCYNEPKLWGYRDEEYYTLDTSHPEAMAYLERIFRTLRRWGAGYFKTDFMRHGLLDSTEVRRHTPGKTSVQYFRDLLAVIRRAIGQESFWLGCIAPFAPFIGYADAMRIGGDVGADWRGTFGPQNMLRESVGSQYFNNVWWQNDPDAILLRDFHLYLTPVEVRALALWQGILGGAVNTSDPLHEIAPDRLRLWRFLEPGDEPCTARLPYWGRTRSLLVTVRPFGRAAQALLVFNPADEARTEVLHLKDAAGWKDAHVWRWGPEGAEPIGRTDVLVPELEPHAAALYYLSRSAAPPPAGLTLGGRTRKAPVPRRPRR